MIDLNIITACSRPHFMRALGNSIYSQLPQGMNVKWRVVVDTNKTTVKEILQATDYVFPDITFYEFRGKVSPGAGNMRNMVFPYVKEGYIHVLDDDNILHPGALTAYVVLANEFREHIFVGDQVLKDGTLRLRGKPSEMRRCAVDSASIMWHASLTVPWDETSYECDGIFVEWLVKNHPQKFVFTNIPISYYNWQTS